MGAPEGDDHPLRFEPHRVRALTHTADSTRPCTPDCTVNSISNVYVISVFDKNVNPGDPEATVQSMRRVRRVRRARARSSSVLGERAGWRETRRGNRATGCGMGRRPCESEGCEASACHLRWFARILRRAREAQFPQFNKFISNSHGSPSDLKKAKQQNIDHVLPLRPARVDPHAARAHICPTTDGRRGAYLPSDVVFWWAVSTYPDFGRVVSTTERYIPNLKRRAGRGAGLACANTIPRTHAYNAQPGTLTFGRARLV